MHKITLIVPCYNEESNIREFYKETKKITDGLQQSFDYLFVNDGSKDTTLQVLIDLANECEDIKYISLSRNFGKESAIFAGLKHAEGDAIILMDADLQHPPSLIPDFINYFNEGFDQVVAKRNRKGDSLVKSVLAKTYYKLMNNMVDVSFESGVGDFRLLSRRAVNSILQLTEYNRFSKGLFSWIGYHIKIINYENIGRHSGESKWSISSLFNYGIDGVISFNNRPLRLCLYIGLLVLFLSISYIFVTFLQIFYSGINVPGYFTLISSVLLLGGVQLVCLGVIGEYIGRIYYETKRRPHYLIDRTNVNVKNDQ